jgi:hypothetical protein
VIALQKLVLNIRKMESKLSLAILKQFDYSNIGAVLVEGILAQEYLAIVQEIQEHFSKLEKPLSRNFLEMLLQDNSSIYENLRHAHNQFFYNLDLFGNGIDPVKATYIMGSMRAVKNMVKNTRQLMIARPEANLDYNSRKGFGYYDNHPLGNWSCFYSVDGENLVFQQHPILHR